ncbi:MAG: hypothetical protein HYT63_03440 [Candidatus Yanofskybacteria bacterium]|nr:hypothetical protein [Candidatus Yanofskybacteria bacterium]
MIISRKNIYILLVLAFIFSFSAGMAGVHTDNMRQMTSCPFMIMDSICQMGIFEHIRAFQNLFSGVPIKSVLISLLLVFLVVSFSVLHLGELPDLFSFSTKENCSLHSFNRILLALSDGRLQPKIYA